MTQSLADPALSALLHGSSTTEADDRLRWMVITWDLASSKPGNKTYVRIFLTDDSFLGVYGVRTPDTFSSVDPSLGTVNETRFCTSQALEHALDHSQVEENVGGVRLLCRPLAVDLSRFAEPDVVEEEPWRDAGALLSHMESGTRKGSAALAAINEARAEAIDTHLAEDWTELFTRTDQLKFWTGR